MTDTEAERIHELVAELRELGEWGRDALRIDHGEQYESLDDGYPRLCDAVEVLMKRVESRGGRNAPYCLEKVRRILEGEK